jgi:hypothetical protein
MASRLTSTAVASSAPCVPTVSNAHLIAIARAVTARTSPGSTPFVLHRRPRQRPHGSAHGSAHGNVHNPARPVLPQRSWFVRCRLSAYGLHHGRLDGEDIRFGGLWEARAWR